MIETNNDYVKRIISEIKNRLIGKNVGTKRAVLVVFKYKEKVKEFHESPEFKNLNYLFYQLSSNYFFSI